MPTAECGDRPMRHDCLARAGEAGVARLNQPQVSVSGPSLAPHQAGLAALPRQAFRGSFVASVFRPTFHAFPFSMGVAQSFAFGAAVGGGGSIPRMGLRARRTHANAGQLAGAAAMLPSGATRPMPDEPCGMGPLAGGRASLRPGSPWKARQSGARKCEDAKRGLVDPTMAGGAEWAGNRTENSD